MSAIAKPSVVSQTSVVVVLALLGLGVLAPLAAWFAVDGAVDGYSLAVLRDGLGRTELKAAFLRTATVALVACAIASLIAVPAALLAARPANTLHPLLLFVGVLPIAVPPLLTALGVRYLVDLFGVDLAPPVAGMPGRGEMLLVLVYALHFCPLLLVTVAVSGGAQARAAGDAARGLGVGRVRTFYRVVLPLAMPGYLLGAAVMLLRIVEDAATPLFVGTSELLATRLLHGWLAQPVDAAALSGTALVILAVGGLILLATWSGLRWPWSPLPHHAAAAPTSAVSHRQARGVLGATLALALLPYLGTALALRDELAEHAADGWSPVLLAGPPTLVFALFGGLLLLLGSLSVGASLPLRGRLYRTLRAALLALLAVPALLLAMAWARWLTGGDALPAAHVGWSLLAAVVAVKTLPVGALWVALRRGGGDPAPHDIARSLPHRRLGGSAPALLRAIAPALPVVLGCGTIAFLGEISAALALLRDADLPLAAALLDAVRGQLAWGQLAGVVLAGTTVLALLTAVAGRRALLRRPLPDSAGDDLWSG